MNGRPPLRHHLSRRSEDRMVTKSAQLWWALSTPSALQLASGEALAIHGDLPCWMPTMGYVVADLGVTPEGGAAVIWPPLPFAPHRAIS